MCKTTQHIYHARLIYTGDLLEVCACVNLVLKLF